MAYELKLQADTITELADKVRSHYHELESIVNVPANLAGVNAAALQNFAAARSEPPVSKAEMDALHGEERSAADVTGQIDKDGLPWDERIHSSNKKMTAKGIWTRRRGISDAEFDQISGELKAAGETNVPPAPYVPPVATAPVYQTPPAPYAPSVQMPPSVQVQPAPQHQYAEIPTHMAAAPVVVPAPTSYQIGDVMNKVSQIFASDPAGGAAYLNSITQRLSVQFKLQVQSITDITNRPDMILFAMQMFAADGK